jgi:hypothetical protein
MQYESFETGENKIVVGANKLTERLMKLANADGFSSLPLNELNDIKAEFADRINGLSEALEVTPEEDVHGEILRARMNLQEAFESAQTATKMAA